MKVVIQRVSKAKVIIDKKVFSSIDKGLLLLVCFEEGDDNNVVAKAAKKVLNLRVFEDSNQKMNLNIQKIHGEILSVSQFTLSWSGEKGNRPSFEKSMSPDDARKKYALFNQLLSESTPVKTGEFGADMQIELINSGPVTFHLSF